MESERLTWKQIQEKYPDQWIGVTDIVFEDENAKTDIASAVVKLTLFLENLSILICQLL